MSVSWRDDCRARLGAHLDASGDLAPPWERFPTYERQCLGWRMGGGEDWMGLWGVFLEQLPADRATRVAYLRRHAPAPISWAHDVAFALGEPALVDEIDEDSGRSEALRAALLEEGLVASDVAFRTWRSQRKAEAWPWDHSETPEAAARYDTRELWFWSRHVAELRAVEGWRSPLVPASWRSCAHAIESGDAGRIDLRDGLLSLAQMLCAGRVLPPWELGLAPSDFTGTYAPSAGYVDAFQLWTMSAFDDREQLDAYLREHPAPTAWRAWIADEVVLS